MFKKKAESKGKWYRWFSPVTWPFSQRRRSTKQVSNIVGDVKQSLKQTKKSRDPWAEGAPDMSDFNQVLAHWEIEEHEIKGGIGGLKAQMFIFTALGLWGAYLMTGGLYDQLHGAPLMAVGLAYFVTKFWRIQVLQRRQFIFFKDWFCWGLFSRVGRETPFAAKARLEKEAPNNE